MNPLLSHELVSKRQSLFLCLYFLYNYKLTFHSKNFERLLVCFCHVVIFFPPWLSTFRFIQRRRVIKKIHSPIQILFSLFLIIGACPLHSPTILTPHLNTFISRIGSFPNIRTHSVETLVQEYTPNLPLHNPHLILLTFELDNRKRNMIIRGTQ